MDPNYVTGEVVVQAAKKELATQRTNFQNKIDYSNREEANNFEKVAKLYLQEDRRHLLFIGAAGEKGDGFFARDAIEKGSFLCCYWGVRIDRNPFDWLKSENGDAYCFTDHTRFIINASDPLTSGWARYVNDDHKTPNVLTKRLTVDGTQHVAFRALRRIEPMEELRYDYGKINLPWRKEQHDQKDSKTETEEISLHIQMDSEPLANIEKDFCLTEIEVSGSEYDQVSLKTLTEKSFTSKTDLPKTTNAENEDTNENIDDTKQDCAQKTLEPEKSSGEVSDGNNSTENTESGHNLWKPKTYNDGYIIIDFNQETSEKTLRKITKIVLQINKNRN